MGAEPRELILPHHAPRQGITRRRREPRREWHIDGELGAEDAREASLARGGREAHRAADIIVIGEGECRESEVARTGDERLGIARAIEQ